MVSDEECAEFAEDAEFLMAKHILLRYSEDGSDTALYDIEELLWQIITYNGSDFDAFFDELMLEYSDDQGGLMQYPHGYLFQEGDMVDSFYEACLSMQIGAFSGIVESMYGYHIIYRVPINYDVIPISFSGQGDYGTLRAYVAQSLFDSVLSQWLDNLEISYTAEYESMDLAAVFGMSGGG